MIALKKSISLQHKSSALNWYATVGHTHMSQSYVRRLKFTTSLQDSIQVLVVNVNQMLPQMMKWGKSRTLVNVPFVAHGHQHLGHVPGVLTTATSRCSLQCLWETLSEHRTFSREWNVPIVLRIIQTFQLFESPLLRTSNMENSCRVLLLLLALIFHCSLLRLTSAQ